MSTPTVLPMVAKVAFDGSRRCGNQHGTVQFGQPATMREQQ
jgi:hypothetical protein